jgi:hypothetical protein
VRFQTDAPEYGFRQTDPSNTTTYCKVSSRKNIPRAGLVGRADVAPETATLVQLLAVKTFIEVGNVEHGAGRAGVRAAVDGDAGRSHLNRRQNTDTRHSILSPMD